MAVTRKPAPAAKPGPRAVPGKPAAGRGAAQRPGAAAPAAGGGFASLRPADMTAGGLLDDIDVVFESCSFVEWDYDGKITTPVLAVLITMSYDDNGEAKSVDQYYSAGDLSRFIPSEDGSHAVPVSGARGLNSNTNAALLLKSVIDAGFPEDNFGDGDITAMNGMGVHINRVPQPKRGGGIADKNESGYDKTVAVVTKINFMPGEEAAPAPAPARPAGGKAAAGRPAPATSAARGKQTAAPPTQADTESDQDLQLEAAGILQEALAAKGGSIPKSGIAPACFKLLAGNANRSAILQLFADADFLGSDEYGWSFDGKTVTAVE